MSSKTAGKQSGKQMSDIIIIDFLDIDPKEFTFGKTRSNPNNKQTNILYKGKKLYARMAYLVTPFAINAKTEITDSKSKKKDDLPPMVNGYTVEPSLPKNFLEEGTLGNLYYLKAMEINAVFMKACVDHRTEWFDIPSERNIDGVTEQLTGVGETNYNSVMKPLLNYSRHKTKDSKGVQPIMLEYPPRFKFTIDAKMGDKTDLDEDGNRKANFVSQFYTPENVEIKNITHLNYSEVVPKFSEIKTLTYWSGFTTCKSWGVFRIILVQCVVKPHEKLSRETNFLCSDDEDESDSEAEVGKPMVNYLDDDEEVPVKTTKSKSKKVVEDDEGGDGIDSFIMSEEMEDVPVLPKSKKTIGIKQRF